MPGGLVFDLFVVYGGSPGSDSHCVVGLLHWVFSLVGIFNLFLWVCLLGVLSVLTQCQCYKLNSNGCGVLLHDGR